MGDKNPSSDKIWQLVNSMSWRYGHYCGACWGDDTMWTKPVDDLDRACMEHDQCYHEIETGKVKPWFPALARRVCDAKLFGAYLKNGIVQSSHAMFKPANFRPRTEADAKLNPTFRECIKKGLAKAAPARVDADSWTYDAGKAGGSDESLLPDAALLSPDDGEAADGSAYDGDGGAAYGALLAPHSPHLL